MPKLDIVLIILVAAILVGLVLLITSAPGRYYEVNWFKGN